MKQIVLLLCALTLAACAPVAQLAQPNERATLTQDGLSLLIANPGPDALTGDPSRKGDGPALNVEGLGLVPDAQAKQWCTLNAAARWGCNLPAIPPGQRLRVTFSSGVISDAALLAYRPSLGSRPVVMWLK